MLNKKSSNSAVSYNQRTEDLKIIPTDDKSFIPLWEKFCSANKVPVSYSLSWIAFCEKILRGNFLKDLSFVVCEGREPLSIVPLIMEKGPYGKQFSVKNGYLLKAPAFALNMPNRSKKEIEKTVFSRIKELAHREGVSLHRVLIDPLFIIDERHHYNYLLKFDYVDSSILTGIIDLEIPINLLWTNLRKSYRPLIKGEMKKYESLIMNSKNISRESFSEFEKLYRLASGRDIYNDSEWGILYEMIKRDEGMVAFARLNNETIGACLFNHLNRKAYYSFSANSPQYEKTFFIGHLLIWKSIEYYLERKFKFLELGWQFHRGQLLERPSDKEINISQFKNGFGGFSFPLYRGIRFFADGIRKEFIRQNLNI